MSGAALGRQSWSSVRQSLVATWSRRHVVPCIATRFLSTNDYKNIIVATKGENDNIGLIQLNRSKALNALNQDLIDDLLTALGDMDKDDKIAAVVLTGNEKAFAAGADIKSMLPKDFSEVYQKNFTVDWDKIAAFRKPLIAAVNGVALGGGCEVAMYCDIIYAGEKAKFGQPEINLAVIPGGGGTQRLPRAVGKSKAMEMVLTGGLISAAEAEKMGLVSKVFPVDQVVDEAIKTAEKIACQSPLVVKIAKEAVNAAYETTLAQGLLFEKRLFHATFATNDRREGMAAFVEKRSPKFTNS